MRFGRAHHPSGPGAVPTAAVAGGPRARSAWRSVVLPAEHGGWGLTLEPGVLGLAVAPSLAGLALAAAGLVAFLLRTPVKQAVVDRRRGRELPRTVLARRVALVEVVVLVGLVGFALWSAGPSWLVPVVLAVPLIGVEAWFEVRSRGRRLVPELCGAVGTGSLAAAVIVAGGGSGLVAAAAWSLLAARSIAAVPYVRSQVKRLHRGDVGGDGVWGATDGADLAQAVGVALAAATVVALPAAALGACAVAATAAVRVVAVRRPPVPAVRLGAMESMFGALVVVATAVGLHVGGAV